MTPILERGYFEKDSYILNQINHCLGFIGGLKENKWYLDTDFDAHIKCMTQQADTCECVIPELIYKTNLVKSIQIPLYSDTSIFPNAQELKKFQGHFDLLLSILEDLDPKIKIIDPNIIEIE